MDALHQRINRVKEKEFIPCQKFHTEIFTIRRQAPKVIITAVTIITTLILLLVTIYCELPHLIKIFNNFMFPLIYVLKNIPEIEGCNSITETKISVTGFIFLNIVKPAKLA